MNNDSAISAQGYNETQYYISISWVTVTGRIANPTAIHQSGQYESVWGGLTRMYIV